MPTFALPENGVYVCQERSLPIIGSALFMEPNEEVYIHNGMFWDAECIYYLNSCVDYSKWLYLLEKIDLDKEIRQGPPGWPTGRYVDWQAHFPESY